MGRKKSIVWNHFLIPEVHSTKATCKYCLVDVGRGQKNMGTTSLMNHLKRCKEFKAQFSYKALNDSTEEQQFESGSGVDMSESNAGQYYHDYEINRSSPSGDEMSALPLSLPPLPESSNINAVIPEYQNNGRPSFLLYGDISSTMPSTRSMEEPTSSSNFEPDMTPAPSDKASSSHKVLTEYMSSNCTVNSIYGGVVLHMLYEQYKKSSFCDLRLVVQNSQPHEGMISETGKIIHERLNNEPTEVKVHSCLLAALSEKIEVLVQMGCNSIQLQKGNYNALRALMEIVYTGKLDVIMTYSRSDIISILEIARFLKVELAVQYLVRERPDINNDEHEFVIGQRENPVSQSGLSMVSKPRPKRTYITPQMLHMKRTYTPKRKSLSGKYSRPSVSRYVEKKRRTITSAVRSNIVSSVLESETSNSDLQAEMSKSPEHEPQTLDFKTQKHSSFSEILKDTILDRMKHENPNLEPSDVSPT